MVQVSDDEIIDVFVKGIDEPDSEYQRGSDFIRLLRELIRGMYNHSIQNSLDNVRDERTALEIMSEMAVRTEVVTQQTLNEVATTGVVEEATRWSSS